jgi:hypothetical protein
LPSVIAAIRDAKKTPSRPRKPRKIKAETEH